MAHGGPGLTIALALAAGILSQTVARHLRIPGIVILLAAGAALGPEGVGIIQPHALGSALHTLVGFAVAVILFEGGLNLDLKRLRREASVIRRLISIGAVITAAGGAAAAHMLLDWPWRLSILFGCLVIVTGPTVIGPLLRRIRVQHKVATVLDAEGVLIDPIGAIVAVVALELALEPGHDAVAAGLEGAGVRMGIGLLLGLVGGFGLAWVLERDTIVPEGLENVFTLAMVLAMYQVSDTMVAESGIMTVTVAGLVVGNTHAPVVRALSEFKEQLTVLFIGMLFVLLAADVSLDDIRGLGVPGLMTVLALMFIVRPLNIAVCTAGSDLKARQRLFLAWLAPRGIVAAAVASLFAKSLDEAGQAGGPQLRALVFLVIAVTVLVQGLSGAWVAERLGLRRPSGNGYVLLGGNALALAIGDLLRANGHDVVVIDSSPHTVRVAEEAGFRVLFGNGLEESVLARAEIETRLGCIGLTSSPEVNLLFTRHVREETRNPRLWLALQRDERSISEQMTAKEGASILFGARRDLDLWALRMRRELATIVRMQVASDRTEPAPLAEAPESLVLPLLVERAGKLEPIGAPALPTVGETIHLALFSEREEQARTWLTEAGLVPADAPALTTGGAG